MYSHPTQDKQRSSLKRKLLNLAQADQEDNPIDADADIETIEVNSTDDTELSQEVE